MFDFIALFVFLGFIALMVAYPKIGAILAGLLVVAFLVTLAFSRRTHGDEATAHGQNRASRHKKAQSLVRIQSGPTLTLAARA
jgi:hypothetical protein